MAVMDLRLRQVPFGSFCMVTLLQVACSISFTGDIPDRTIKAKLDDDVALGWSFSFNDLGGNPVGPFGAPDVYEISFGIYKSIHGETFLLDLIEKWIGATQNTN
nr:uncharacterized protein LOC131782833 [Pocillopora verrucosa]